MIDPAVRPATKKPRRQALAEATRQALVETAFDHFAAAGYLKTSLDDIVTDAGLTKGALYHHFRNKEDLFAACFELQVQALAETIRAAPVSGLDPWEAMLARCQAFLGFGRQRRHIIPLTEAMSVLGWARTREIDMRHTMGIVRDNVRALAQAGQISTVSTEIAANLVYSLLVEAAVSAAHATDATRAAVFASLAQMLGGLRVPGPQAASN